MVVKAEQRGDVIKFIAYGHWLATVIKPGVVVRNIKIVLLPSIKQELDKRIQECF